MKTDEYLRLKKEADEKQEAYWQNQYANLLGCSDGSCIIKRPKGMHTNGGCGCNKELSRILRKENPELYKRIMIALQFYQREYLKNGEK